MHAKFEGENLKIERAVSILVKWVSIMWSNLKTCCLNITLRWNKNNCCNINGYVYEKNLIGMRRCCVPGSDCQKHLLNETSKCIRSLGVVIFPSGLTLSYGKLLGIIHMMYFSSRMNSYVKAVYTPVLKGGMLPFIQSIIGQSKLKIIIIF
jgi:hypothetical protein